MSASYTVSCQKPGSFWTSIIYSFTYNSRIYICTIYTKFYIENHALIHVAHVLTAPNLLLQEFSLFDVGTDRAENTAFHDALNYCVHILCSGNVFTEPLRCCGWLLLLKCLIMSQYEAYVFYCTKSDLKLKLMPVTTAAAFTKGLK
jgi:hypothetical protein